MYNFNTPYRISRKPPHDALYYYAWAVGLLPRGPEESYNYMHLYTDWGGPYKSDKGELVGAGTTDSAYAWKRIHLNINIAGYSNERLDWRRRNK